MKVLVIGNKNAITYKQVWPHIQQDRLWLGTSGFNKDILFTVPDDYEWEGLPASAKKAVDGKTYRRAPAIWFTNLDHGQRHQRLDLTERYEQ